MAIVISLSLRMLKVSVLRSKKVWLKSGQYQTCGVSVALDEATTISDWSRTIALDDVYVSVQTNENGYPTLVISSHPIEE